MFEIVTLFHQQTGKNGRLNIIRPKLAKRQIVELHDVNHVFDIYERQY